MRRVLFCVNTDHHRQIPIPYKYIEQRNVLLFLPLCYSPFILRLLSADSKTRADFCLRTGLISCYAILCDMPRINTFRPHLRLP